MSKANVTIAIKLVVFCANYERPNDLKILLSQEKLVPTKFLEGDDTCMDTAADLLYQHTGLEAKREDGKGWITIDQSGIYDDMKTGGDKSRVIHIGYGCIIPEETKLKDGNSWIPISKIVSDNLINKEDLHVILNTGSNI